MRDRTVGDTFYMLFTTRAFATGVPTTLAGTPVVSAYEDNSATQITAGITLGVDHDSVTGLNLLTIVATGGNGFETGKDYSLVITTGTVGGVSVLGEVVGEFSLDLSASLKAVDALNDVAATDIVSAGAITTLSGAVVNVDLVDTLTTYTGNTPQTADHTASIADIPTIAEFNARTLLAADYFDPAADTVATVTTVTNGATSAELAKVPKSDGTSTWNATALASINAECDTALTDYDGPTNAEMNARTLLAADYFDPAADTVANVTTVATTTTNADMRGTDSAFLAASAPSNFSALGINVGGDISVVTLVDTCTANTDMRGTDGANTVVPDNAGITANGVAIGNLNDISVNDILTTQMSESYAADGVAPTLAQALMLIQQTIGDFSIAGTTITTKQLDGASTAATYTLDDGTNPTSRTRST